MIKEAFKDPDLNIVTGKNIKGMVYTDAGYQLSCNEELRRAVEEGENAYDRRLGADIFAPVYPDGKGYGFPYETDVALNKALYLIKALEEQKESIGPYAVTDSIWTIGETALNKPISGKDNPTEALVDFYCRHVKMSISTQTGVAFVRVDDLQDWEIGLRQVTLRIGDLNPDLDRDVLERIISDNPHITGGLPLKTAIENKIITPFESMTWLIKDFSLLNLKEIKKKEDGGSFKGVLKVNSGELSFDPVNELGLLSLIFGMPPR